MDFYKNADFLDCGDKSEPKIYGIRYRVVTDLATEPVDLPFFKEHARIDFDTDDNLCATYIKSARQYLEAWAQLSFGVKTIGLTALHLPKKYQLMHGPVDTIITPDFTNFGDNLMEGGENIDIEYTTLGIINEDIKVAICRKAASIYLNRETKVDSKYQASVLEDEAKEMVRPYANLTLL